MRLARTFYLKLTSLLPQLPQSGQRVEYRGYRAHLNSSCAIGEEALSAVYTPRPTTESWYLISSQVGSMGALDITLVARRQVQGMALNGHGTSWGAREVIAAANSQEAKVAILVSMSRLQDALNTAVQLWLCTTTLDRRINPPLSRCRSQSSSSSPPHSAHFSACYLDATPSGPVAPLPFVALARARSHPL